MMSPTFFTLLVKFVKKCHPYVIQIKGKEIHLNKKKKRVNTFIKKKKNIKKV